ncbi:zinc finger CW-type PWWP domain protein 2-like isoform X2 [Lethenteron reissneri]|uniref:zinc finger CW-type PWWP domain protein 2-like isoform X2 n=1 Tax=Lethenteron reissneri TaxID=7753 RepID=UPI002AB7A40F|nr:zinc finger CW-type PWWP domain protein 2-like isoform X2 [Lethenteron reissneri]
MATAKRKYNSSRRSKGLGDQEKEEDLAWVQCEHLDCQKWRSISVKEMASLAVELPWYCHMNGDISHSSCEDLEEPYPSIEELTCHGLEVVFSHNYQTGSLVWAKMTGYPRWPAVVCPDPDNGKDMNRKHNDVSYHVEYLGQPRSRKWINVQQMEPFSQLKNVPSKARNGGWLNTALKEANEMISIPCEERLHLCHFTGSNSTGEEMLQETYHLLMEVDILNENMIDKKKCDSQPYTQRSFHEESFQNDEDSPDELVKAKTIYSDDSVEMQHSSLSNEYEEMENLLEETAAWLQDDG